MSDEETKETPEQEPTETTGTEPITEPTPKTEPAPEGEALV